MTQIIGHGASDDEVLRFQLRRLVTLLFKRQLDILDDIVVAHDDALNKLAANLPKDYHPYLDLADYLSDAKADQLRKKILDSGNETIRAAEDLLKEFDTRLK